MVAHREYRPAAKDPGKARKVVALVRRQDKGNIAAAAAKCIGDRRHALNMHTVMLGQDEDIIETAAIRKTWKEHYDLVQQQREATQEAAQILQQCLARLTNQKDTATAICMAKAYLKEDQETGEERTPPLQRRQEQMTTTTTTTAKEQHATASDFENEHVDKSAQLLQLCWWRELSDEEVSRVARLPKSELQLGDVRRYILNAKREPRQRTQINGTKGKEDKKTQKENTRVIVEPEEPARRKLPTPSTHSVVPKAAVELGLGADTDMRSLYKRAFEVRQADVRAARRRETTTAIRIQEWRRKMRDTLQKSQDRSGKEECSSIIAGASHQHSSSSLVGAIQQHQDAILEQQKLHHYTTALEKYHICTVRNHNYQGYDQNHQMGKMLIHLIVVGAVLALTALFYVDGIVSVKYHNTGNIR